MAFRIVFHYGENTYEARQEEPYWSQHWVYQNMGKFEELKPHGDPKIAQLAGYFERTKENYYFLEALVECLKQRVVDPATKCGMKTFVPLGIEEFHIWMPDNEYLPWEDTKPRSTRYWNNSIPKYLEGFDYKVEYHGDEDSVMKVPSKKRRREYLKVQYKPKHFKPSED